MNLFRRLKAKFDPLRSEDNFATSDLHDQCTFMADENLNSVATTPEEIMVKKLNHWKGWHCSAGVENIFINAVGDVYAAVCQEGGILGNVFTGGLKVQDQWTVCGRNFCFCGADMRLTKTKHKHLVEKAGSLTLKDLNFTQTKQLDPAQAVHIGRIWERERPLNISWDLGPRCNYSCSYCPPGTSDKQTPFVSAEALESAILEIERFFCRGRKAKFVFTGGEPTLIPHYLDFVKNIASNGHNVHTQTNGSRLPEYYRSLLDYSLIGFSFHHEFAKPERFLAMISHLIEAKRNVTHLKDRWIGVRVMSGPGDLEKSLAIKTLLLALDDTKTLLNHVIVAPLFEGFNFAKLQNYSQTELQNMESHLI